MAPKNKRSKAKSTPVDTLAPNATPKEVTADRAAASAPAAGVLPTKAEFIRSFPREVPATVVAQKAKAIGIDISVNHVSAVRSTMKKAAENKGAPKKPGPKPRAPITAPRASVPAGAKPRTKTEFVLSLPASLSASDVVREASAAGIRITPKYVYVIRSHAKVSAGVAKKRGRPPGRPRAVVAEVPRTAPAPHSSDESAFKRLVVALGVESARKFVDEVRQKLDALFE